MNVLQHSLFSRITMYNFSSFYTSVSQWFFTGVWVTASFLKSPGFLLLFRQISAMMKFGWFQLVPNFFTSSVPCTILGDYTENPNYNWFKRHFHVPVFQFPRNVQILIFLFVFFQFYTLVSRDSKIYKSASALFCWLFLGLVVCLRIDLSLGHEWHFFTSALLEY